jgi:hypothetical protein
MMGLYRDVLSIFVGGAMVYWFVLVLREHRQFNRMVRERDALLARWEKLMAGLESAAAERKDR